MQNELLKLQQTPQVNYDIRSSGHLYSAWLSLYSLALLFITSEINRLLLLLLLLQVENKLC